jgi:hypothetical protein
VRAAQESAEAIVAKKAGESRKERRAEEPRDRPTDELWQRAERGVFRSRLGATRKGHFQDWSERTKGVELPQNQKTGGEPATRRTKVKEGAE